jgi:U4/U6 small nuclear ribonucleoprotein PRP3
LTKVQKKDKAIRKLKRDSAKECRRAIFKIGKLDDPTIYFKVDTNAKQLALNGFIIKPSDYHRQVVMVAVEGGAKAIRFYKNLMLNRIRWDKGDDNKCVLVW